MIMLLRCVALLASTALIMLPASQDSRAFDEAKSLFARFVQLEQSYDPRVADLYADDAVITAKRVYPTGEVRELTFPAPKYKQLIRQALPLAKARGDRSTYTNCTYEPQGPRVRVACSRYSELKKYTSPYTLLVGPGGSGRWQIVEERSESRP